MDKEKHKKYKQYRYDRRLYVRAERLNEDELTVGDVYVHNNLIYLITNKTKNKNKCQP